MDGDSGDEGSGELTCVRPDESDKSLWSVRRQSSLGSWFTDREMRDGKNGYWPSERKRKVGESGLRNLKNECYAVKMPKRHLRYSQKLSVADRWWFDERWNTGTEWL